MNEAEALAWLTDVLDQMVSGRIKAKELKDLLPWIGGPNGPRPPLMHDAGTSGVR